MLFAYSFINLFSNYLLSMYGITGTVKNTGGHNNDQDRGLAMEKHPVKDTIIVLRDMG